MLNKNTLPTDDDFCELEQKLQQLKQLLQEIEHGIKNGGTVKTFKTHIERAKQIRNECDGLKRDIQRKIRKNIH